MTSWIPIRRNLYDSPKTFLVARQLKVDRFTVVGMVVYVWSWVGEHSIDGHIPDLDVDGLDEIVGIDGIGDAMLRAGWLQISGGDLLFPEWDQWNGQCTKKRLLDARRKQRKRKLESTA